MYQKSHFTNNCGHDLSRQKIHLKVWFNTSIKVLNINILEIKFYEKNFETCEMLFDFFEKHIFHFFLFIFFFYLIRKLFTTFLIKYTFRVKPSQNDRHGDIGIIGWVGMTDIEISKFMYILKLLTLFIVSIYALFSVVRQNASNTSNIDRLSRRHVVLHFLSTFHRGEV